MPASCYGDTSFVVKAYLTEPGSSEVSMFSQAGIPVLITSLTDVDVCSTFYRKLNARDAALATRVYEQDVVSGLYQHVGMSTGVYD